MNIFFKVSLNITILEKKIFGKFVKLQKKKEHVATYCMFQVY